MKKIILIISIILPFFAFSQTPVSAPQFNRSNGFNTMNDPHLKGSLSVHIPVVDSVNLNGGLDSAGAIVYNSADSSVYVYMGNSEWKKIGSDDSTTVIEELLDGGDFTTDNSFIGFNPGTNLTAREIVEQVFYGLQPPTATLTGGATLELTISSVARTLSWGAGRGTNTPPITTINVAGFNQTFSQPPLSGSVNGTQAVSVPANTPTTYVNLVTDDSGHTGTASTNFTFLPRKYYGWISDTTGITTGTQDAVIRALADQPLTTNPAFTFNRTIAGTQFFVIIFPESFGELTSLTFNGFNALEAMNTMTKAFTNGQGYTQSYRYYWNKLAQNTTSEIIGQ